MNKQKARPFDRLRTRPFETDSFGVLLREPGLLIRVPEEGGMPPVSKGADGIKEISAHGKKGNEKMKPTGAFLRLTALLLLTLFAVACQDRERKKEPQFGAITAQLVWPAETQLNALLEDTDSFRWFIPAGVTNIRGYVTASDITNPPETIIPVTEGDSGTGIITDVPVGASRTLTVEGRDASNTVIYSGSTTGITVAAGVTEDVGEVVMDSIGGGDGGGNLVGSWAYSCIDDVDASITFTSTSGNWASNYYEFGTGCSGTPESQFIETLTYTLGSVISLNSGEDVSQFDATDTAHTATMNTQALVDESNAYAKHGYTDWEVGVEKDILGLNWDGTTYTDLTWQNIIYVDTSVTPNTLQLGDWNQPMDADGYHTVLDLLEWVKQ